MNCQNCNSQIPDGYAFCVVCGSQIQAPAQRPAASGYSAEPNTFMQPRYAYSSAACYPSAYGSAAACGDPGGAYGYSSAYGCVNPMPASSVRSGRCRTCRTVVQEQTVCPNCGGADIDRKPDLWMGILALVFSVLGGWFGLLFGVMGIRSAKKTGYTPLKILSVIAIPLCIVSMIVWNIIIQEIV